MVTIGKENCDIFCIDEHKVTRVQERLGKIDLDAEIDLFKALSNNNRIKILYALSIEEELCVCDIALIIDSSVANTSHHLRYLHDLDIVNYRKEGKVSYYYLTSSVIKNILSQLESLKIEVS
ncbi:MAG: metalloregulator ArsR/SmtB family transcription factor [Atopococcus tabaci]|uniref:Metalloregulator ArsR/SmtB family transcription factor n=1 Tax=Atopococcus tabaci TaxID=269774 RepID=A0AA43ZS68_9LACT|nr:metalloregulator ArsR/SmtB family transcription factor [Atopococcus tabaci]